MGYQIVIWFNGYPYSNTFNSDNEAAVGAYLDAGGRFFFSSQDYLYDAGLTAFGQNYLHISSYTSDVSQTTVTGQGVFAGLGPYSLSYPFTNYSDVVNPDAQAAVAFSGNQGNAAISFENATFKTAFLGYPLEAIPGLADRAAVLSAAVDWFGGCGPTPTMHVLDINIVGRAWMDTFQAKGLVVVEDDMGNRMEDADTQVELTAPNWGPRPTSRLTNWNGMARFRWGSRFGGDWTLCVTDIVKGSYAYEPGDNYETCATVTYP
jgi:hypothetical protein